MDTPDACKYNIEDIHKITPLGKGGYGEVFLGEIGAEQFVVKKQNKSPDKNLKILKNEVIINKMIECRIKNLLCYRGCSEDVHYIYLLFDYIPNVIDMYNKYWKPDKYISVRNVKNVLSIMIDMAKAVENIHGIGILHLDLKPENFLVDKGENADKTDGTNAYLIDYGYSCVMNEKNLCVSNELKGTIVYMAPEMVDIKSSTRMIGTWTDVYSLGMVFYEFLSYDRTSPYEIGLHGGTDNEIDRQIMENIKTRSVPHISFNSKYKKFINESVYDCIMLMISKDIQKRPTIAYVIDTFGGSAYPRNPHAQG